MEKITETSELVNVKTGELPYNVSVGGYGLTYIGAHFNDVLCAECANQWTPEGIAENVTGGFIYWEGAPLICDSCNCAIESEYGDPDEPDEPDEEGTE